MSLIVNIPPKQSVPVRQKPALTISFNNVNPISEDFVITNKDAQKLHVINLNDVTDLAHLDANMKFNLCVPHTDTSRYSFNSISPLTNFEIFNNQNYVKSITLENI